MLLTFPTHTIIFTVAPSNAGKSYFLNNYLVKQLKNQYSDYNIQYLSTDDIRRDLLGDSTKHKHDPEMLQVSAQCFDVLYNKLNNILSFPVKAEIVVIDSTGLSEVFRNDLINVSKKHHYNIVPIVFDYNNRNDYFSFADEHTSNTVISKHIDKLKKDVLQTLKKDKYTTVYRIKEKDFDCLDLSFEISDYDFYKSHIINDTKNEYVVVSDVHNCINELKELIRKNDCIIDDNDNIIGEKVFILQDFIDKGYDLSQTIKFVHQNTLNGKIKPLIGNHENYVYKRIKGLLSENVDHDKFFDSVQPLLNPENESIKNMFIDIFENHAKHFYKHKNFFVNHAPCELKYLGKVDSISLKKQRSFIYPKYNNDLSLDENIKLVEESIQPLIKDGDKNFNSKPIVWGHVSMLNYKVFGNIHMIDTGSVSYNKLTSICFDNRGNKYMKYVSFKNKLDKQPDVLNLFDTNKIDKEYRIDILEPDEKRRVDFLIKNKVNFISGTVSPSDKNKETNTLEDLEQGLLYYKNNNVNKVILQPKYMGSRCNIYLNKDIEKTYCVTRNGYLVKVDVAEALKALYDIDYIKQQFENGAEIIILDSELLPWSAIGKGLIEHEFLAVKTGINSELEILKSTGFEKQLNDLLNTNVDKLEEFKADLNILKKQQVVDKYGYRTYETLRNLIDYVKEHSSLEQTEKFVTVYNRQMDLFANFDVPTEFKPFSILKVINTDGTEKTLFNESNIEIFKNISKDKYCVVDFNDVDWLEKANEYYNEITNNMEMEGIVIKPEIVYTKNLAPYMKVRNLNYLSIVYGYDFRKENKYNKLIQRKSIKQKLKSSITEFEIGKRMLEQPYDKIDKENKELISLYIQMILDEKKVVTLDPRL